MGLSTDHLTKSILSGTVATGGFVGIGGGLIVKAATLWIGGIAVAVLGTILTLYCAKWSRKEVT